MPPLTFFFRLSDLPPWAARTALLEFAENGQRDVVLSDGILRQMLGASSAIRSYRKLLEETGTAFRDAHATYGELDDLCCPYEDLRPAMLARHRLSMEIAASFGVDTLTIHMGRIADWSIPPRRYIDFALSSLEELLPHAERTGVTLCIENVWYQTSSASSLLEAVRRFPTPALGVCYDAAHANIMAGRNRAPENRMWGTYPDREPDWNDHVLEDVLPYVVNCHLHDNDGASDQHRLPGEGTVPWAAVMPLLLSAPRLRCIQCEAGASSTFQPVFSIRRAVETLRRLVATGSPA